MSNYNNNTDDNPWADPARDNLRPPHDQQQPNVNSNNPFYQQSNSPNPWQLGGQENANYAPPPGPPPGYANQQQQQQPWSQPGQQTNPYAQNQQEPIPGLAPRNKTSTFNEGDFIPAGERGEQREAMEQFEITNSRPQSTDDRNIEQLQQEFPGLDGSLVAAIYMDSKQMGAVREMLGELSSGK
ncbi:hypothetical protein Q7P37_004175 [Cladosporium fusiforme]